MNIARSRQQARDEATAPETLAELAKSKDYLTRQYVAVMQEIFYSIEQFYSASLN